MERRTGIIIDGKAYEVVFESKPVEGGIEVTGRLVPINVVLVGDKERWVQHNGRAFPIYEGAERLDE